MMSASVNPTGYFASAWPPPHTDKSSEHKMIASRSKVAQMFTKRKTRKSPRKSIKKNKRRFWSRWREPSVEVPNKLEPSTNVPQRPSFLPLKDVDVIEKADSVINIQAEVQHEEESSAKTKLINILNEQKSNADSIVQEIPHEKGQGEMENSFLRKGSNFVRSSFRKFKSFGGKTPLKGKEGNNVKKTSTNGCNESQDSGLGEDSDFDATHKDTSLLSSLSTTPGASSALPCPSSTSLTSSLRKSGATSASTKHVMIREPCLSILPSSSRRFQSQCRRETVRVFPRANRIPNVVHTGCPTGSVSGQWSQILSAVQDIILVRVSGCHPDVVKLVLSPNERDLRQNLDSVSDPSQVIHGVYKLLFFDWLSPQPHPLFAIVLHSVQRFLVVLIDVVDLDMDDRLRLSKAFRDLLRQCEQSGYKDVKVCLIMTRKVYIDLWCALLLAPFAGEEVTSPTLSEVRRSFSKNKID